MLLNKRNQFFFIILTTFLISILANTQIIGYWKITKKFSHVPGEPTPMCCLDSYYGYLNPIFWLPHILPMEQIHYLITHGKKCEVNCSLYTPFKIYLSNIYSKNLQQKPLDIFTKPCILRLNCLKSFPLTDIKNIQFYYPFDGNEILFWLFILYWFVLALIIVKLIKKFFTKT